MHDIIRETYYNHRASIYDATSYRGDPRIDACLDREQSEIGRVLSSSLPGGRIVDVGCGTGVWTQFLPGQVVAMDQSQKMLDIARTRVPNACFVRSLFPPLPFQDGEFDIVFSANFYGLLRPEERAVFLAEASRVAHTLVVLDLRSDGDTHREGLEQREVGGVGYAIFRRRFTPPSLITELGGEILYRGRYFLVLHTSLREALPNSAPPNAKR